MVTKDISVFAKEFNDIIKMSTDYDVIKAATKAVCGKYPALANKSLIPTPGKEVIDSKQFIAITSK